MRTLTGEYCLREGTYSKTLPDNLATMPGTPCLRVDAITCVRWAGGGVQAQLQGWLLLGHRAAGRALRTLPSRCSASVEPLSLCWHVTSCLGLLLQDPAAHDRLAAKHCFGGNDSLQLTAALRSCLLAYLFRQCHSGQWPP